MIFIMWHVILSDLSKNYVNRYFPRSLSYSTELNEWKFLSSHFEQDLHTRLYLKSFQQFRPFFDFFTHYFLSLPVFNVPELSREKYWHASQFYREPARLTFLLTDAQLTDCDYSPTESLNFEYSYVICDPNLTKSIENNVQITVLKKWDSWNDSGRKLCTLSFCRLGKELNVTVDYCI